jgi:hypothetical protein
MLTRRSKPPTIDNVWKKSYLETRKGQLKARTSKMALDPLEEIALGVSRVDGPPVIHRDIEDGEENDEECRSPSGLEANGDHDTSGETHDRYDDTSEGPLALEDNTDE